MTETRGATNAPRISAAVWAARSAELLAGALGCGLVAGIASALYEWSRYRPVAAGLLALDVFAHFVGSAVAVAAAAGAAGAALLGGLALVRGAAGEWIASLVAATALVTLPGLAGLQWLDERLPAGWSAWTRLGSAALVLLAAAWLGLVLARLLVAWQERPARPARPVVLAGGLALLVALSLEAAVALHRPASSTPKVLLIAIDALRADHLGSAGYPRPTTPALDRLAADGVAFGTAISQSTFTKTSVASLLTGLYPHHHGVYEGSRAGEAGRLSADVLDARHLTLAEILREHGLATGAWVHNAQLHPAAGFDQGFLLYRYDAGYIPHLPRRYRSWQRWLGARHPFFAYLHFLDLHDPYRPPPPYDSLYGRFEDPYVEADPARFHAFRHAVAEGRIRLTRGQVEQLESWYDGLLTLTDRAIGRILDDARAAGWYDDALVVVTSDHGDGFLEHGFISHSNLPYDELIRVPLLVKLPGGRHAGARVGAQVRLIDVAPTILDVLGIPAPPGLDGASLLPLLEPGAAAPSGSRAVALSEFYRSLAVRTQRWKLLRTETGERRLYDLANDPGETRDVGAARPGILAALREVERTVQEARRRADAPRVELDPKTVEGLRALGYVD